MLDCTFAYKGYCFDTSCGFDQLWLHSLVSVIDAQDVKDAWLEKARDYFCLQIEAHMGFLYLKLDYWIEEDSTREARLIEISKQAYDRLRTLYPGYIPRGVANEISESTGTFARDVSTEDILEVGELFIKLLEGNVDSDPRFMAELPGAIARYNARRSGSV